MMASSIFLLIFSGLVTVYPAEFQQLTGLNTSDATPLNFTESGLNSDDVSLDDPSVCRDLTTLNRTDVVDRDGGLAKNTSASIGWIRFNTSMIDSVYYNKSTESAFNYYFGEWITLEYENIPEGYTDNDDRFVRFGGGQSTGTLNTEGQGWINFTFKNDDAVIYELVNSCKVDGDDSGALFNNPVVNVVTDFAGVIGDFFGIVFALISNLFELLTLGGNEASTWVLRIVLIPQVIGWLYIIVDGIGEFFG